MRVMSWCFGLVGLIAITAGGQSETVVVDGKFPAGDACLTVAGAKQAQWSQNPLLIREFKMYDHDVAKVSETIFTADHAYAHYIGNAWNAMAINVPERSIRSPQDMAKRMKLESCQLVGLGTDAGTHLYSFTYLPDNDGSHSAGQIEISDATGLPVEQVIYTHAAHPDADDPIKITAMFSYGKDVQVPTAASLSEIDSRDRQQRQIKDMQNRGGFMGH